MIFFTSNQVKNSNAMEKRGLKLAVKWLQQHHLQIGIIITDRHLQIQKWIRENLPQTTHYYDVWQVAKGKLVARKEQLVLKNQQIHVCIVVLQLFTSSFIFIQA